MKIFDDIIGGRRLIIYKYDNEDYFVVKTTQKDDYKSYSLYEEEPVLPGDEPPQMPGKSAGSPIEDDSDDLNELLIGCGFSVAEIAAIMKKIGISNSI